MVKYDGYWISSRGRVAVQDLIVVYDGQSESSLFYFLWRKQKILLFIKNENRTKSYSNLLCLPIENELY